MKFKVISQWSTSHRLATAKGATVPFCTISLCLGTQLYAIRPTVPGVLFSGKINHREIVLMYKKIFDGIIFVKMFHVFMVCHQ